MAVSPSTSEGIGGGCVIFVVEVAGESHGESAGSSLHRLSCVGGVKMGEDAQEEFVDIVEEVKCVKSWFIVRDDEGTNSPFMQGTLEPASNAELASVETEPETFGRKGGKESDDFEGVVIVADEGSGSTSSADGR